MGKEDVAHIMEYYVAIKREKIVPIADIWMDLETIIQDEMSERENKHHILTHICDTYTDSESGKIFKILNAK